MNAQHKWSLRKDADSVKVYTSHTDDSGFKSIKAVFTVNAKLSAIAAMVWNIERYTAWQFNTTKAKVLKVISDHEMVYHAEIEAPWPVSDRDMVVNLKITQDPSTKVMTISTVGLPNYIPHMEERVRVPMSKAQWIVKPINKNKAHVEYFIQIDPGGSVPAWMVNMVCVEAPYESFVKMRSLIGKERNKPLAFVVD